MRSEKKGFQTTQGPPQEVSRRPRTLQGLEVGANLAPRGVPKSIQNRSKSELASPQDPRPSRDPPKIPKWTPKWVPNRCEINFEIHLKFIQHRCEMRLQTLLEANRRHSPTLEKALCHAPFLAYGILGRSPCHPAAAEGAKLSKMLLD
jgi:hypothetical protein